MGLAVGLVVGVSGGGVAPNTAPTNSVPGAQSVYVGSTLTFSSGGGNALTVADPDGGNLTATLAASHGTLSLSGTSGLTFLSGDGTDDATMQFTGTAAAINAALSGMVYTPTTGYTGADTLTLTTNDGRGGIDQDTVAITVSFNTSNIAAYFKLSDTSDASGNSNTLTNTNSVTFGAGKLGNCAEFSGSNFLSRADNASLSLGDVDFYACCFFQHTDQGSNHTIACKASGGGASTLEFTWRINTSDRMVMGISNGTTDTVLTADAVGQPVLAESTWYFGEIWHKAGDNQIGVAVDRVEKTGAWSLGSWDSGSPFYLGTLAAGLFSMTGKIDNFIFFKGRVPNQIERDYLYNGGAGREPL